MSGINQLKALAAKHADYIVQAGKRFDIKPFQQIQAEAKARNIPASNIYAYPGAFYESLIAQGAFIPIIIYNNTTLQGNAQLFDLKLQQWDAMRSAFQARLDNPATFGADYERWKQDDAAFANLTEDQRKVLYCAEIMRAKYFTYVADAPMLDSIGTLSETAKIRGDCDTLSRVFAGFLLGATDAQGRKIFHQNMITFDHPPEHERLLIRIPGKETIIFESTPPGGNAAGINGPNGRQFEAQLKVGPGFKGSVVEEIGAELASQPIEADKGDAFARWTVQRLVATMSPQRTQSTEHYNYYVGAYNLLNGRYKEMFDRAKKMVDQYNSGASIDDGEYRTLLSDVVRLKGYLKTYSALGPATLKNGFQTTMRGVEEFLRAAKTINPVTFEEVMQAPNIALPVMSQSQPSAPPPQAIASSTPPIASPVQSGPVYECPLSLDNDQHIFDPGTCKSLPNGIGSNRSQGK